MNGRKSSEPALLASCGVYGGGIFAVESPMFVQQRVAVARLAPVLTFMGEDVVKGRHSEAQHVPRMLKWDKVLKVVSRGNKIIKGEL